MAKLHRVKLTGEYVLFKIEDGYVDVWWQGGILEVVMFERIKQYGEIRQSDVRRWIEIHAPKPMRY